MGRQFLVGIETDGYWCYCLSAKVDLANNGDDGHAAAAAAAAAADAEDEDATDGD